ncbi:prepilin-type N-terminal cleavage/methylation domain-containing protein [Desulfurobacterium atlanticum]|uniref:Prepilin-type N-terminal cleavage/methylation domain-containing protein n=1 Tax=Desulfurobacterium atlanticum TaxID=240169 RepID=A0A238ZCQ4_9BACT|nr:prepilin-type N-terminal cleavage/methylation domain-containing protein [Desulfurobacterium atlanticum]SNR80484.1 prepilin-type N-terminal cleavage/methylation domain-containing protein [Desulfurobacterium atlanticum]
MKSRKGVTLLELLIVVTLFAVIFSAVEFLFSGTIFSSASLSSRVNKDTEAISFYSQLSAQLFSSFNPRRENFLLDSDTLSFYTLSPLFYPCGVRAEYRFKKDNGTVEVVYEEFPYPDGRLGEEGKRKVVIGRFSDVKFYVYVNGEWKDAYRGSFQGIGKVEIDGREYIITGKVK